MNQTPVKTPSVTLTSAHQISVEKTKALYDKAQNFMESNFKKSHEGSDQKMASSSEFLSNTKAFFESELQLVLRMVEQSNKLYQQKENENLELAKKVKDYQSMIGKLREIIEKQKANKAKNQVTIIDQNDESKTRKKGSSSEVGNPKSHVSAPSQFTVSQSKSIENSQIQKTQKVNKKKREHEEALRFPKAQHLEEKTNQWCKQIQQLRYELVLTKENNQKLAQQLNLLQQEKDKLQNKYSNLEKEYGDLFSRYSILQERYKELQEIHGKTVAQYEIKLQNLKNLLKGIQEQVSPKKFQEKYNEGYYSINRPLNKNESQESFESQNTSKEYAFSHAESNLREENQYLRTQLIQVLDDKGEIQMKLNKYRKLASKLDIQIKQIKQKSKLHSQGDENNQALSNLDQSKKGQKSAQSFKKNKNTSVLVVENTEKNEKEILEEVKIKNLLQKINVYLINEVGIEVKIDFTSKAVQIQFLQSILQTLKTYFDRVECLNNLLKKSQEENKKLKKEKSELNKKEKSDAEELEEFLKESSESSSFSKSRDSTDHVFRRIKVKRILEQKKQQMIQQISIQSNSILLQTKQAQNNILRAQIEGLNHRIQFLEKQVDLLAKENEAYKFEKQQRVKNEVKQSRIATYSPSKQACLDLRCLQYSPFDMFKQKLTEFYQHTIKELDDWSASATKSFPSPNKKLPQIQNQQNYTIPQFQIPEIVGRNLMKMSQEFKSIQNSSFDKESIAKNEEYGNMLFKQQKLSQSFIKEQSDNSDSLQEMVNKKFEDLQQFSSNWISKLLSKDAEKKDSSQESAKIPDLTLKQVAKQHHEIVVMKEAKTDRSAVEKKYPFECDLEGIDCVSEEMSHSQIMSEKRIFIREEISYFIHKNEQLDGLLKRCKSKSSFGSFNG